YLGEGTSRGEQAQPAPPLKLRYYPQKNRFCFWQNWINNAGNDMKHKPLAQNQGFSLIELLIVIAIILIIAAIAIPNLLRSKLAANEAAAVSNMRSITTAEATYSASYGSAQGYAPQLALLGPGATCDPTHACIIDNVLGCPNEPCFKDGFNFFVMSNSAAIPFLDFAVTSTPQNWGGTGAKNLCA